MRTVKKFIASLFSRKFLAAIGAFVTAVSANIPSGQKVTATMIILAIYSAVNIADKVWEK